MPANATQSGGTGAPGACIASLPETPPDTSCADPPCLPGAGSQSPSTPLCPSILFLSSGCQPQVHGRSFPPHKQVEKTQRKFHSARHFGADLACISDAGE